MITRLQTLSRHTVVCRAAQEAGAPHPWVIQISTKLRQVFPRYESSKIGWVSSFFFLLFFCLFFFFLSNNKNCHKMQTRYLIVLKFGTQQDSVSAHRGIKFGCNTVNGHKVINNYSQKIAPNMLSLLQGKLLMARTWKLARRQGNYWSSNLLLFERNWAKDHEDKAKNPTVGNNYAIEIY